MSEGFLGKAYGTIAIVWAAAVILCLVLHKPWTALSVTLGTALGTALLVSLHLVIRTAFVPGARKPSRALLKLGLVKYPILLAVMYLLVRWEKLSIGALVGGVVVVYFAITVLAVGVMIAERPGMRKGAHDMKRN